MGKIVEERKTNLSFADSDLDFAAYVDFTGSGMGALQGNCLCMGKLAF